MTKYKTTVDALQLTTTNVAACQQFVGPNASVIRDRLVLVVPGPSRRVEPGEWIVKHQDGRVSVHDDAEFKRLFEAAVAPAPPKAVKAEEVKVP